jgi:putative transposase
MAMNKNRVRAEAARAAEVALPAGLMNELVKGPMTAMQVESLSQAFKRALIERVMKSELSDHLGYEAGEEKPAGQTNQRNGTSAKTVLTGAGPVQIEVPRDRAGTFEPILIPKHERRYTGFDDHILALYSRGMTYREIQGFLKAQYATEVSSEFISTVTDGVLSEVSAWQSRPLETLYPVVFFDALRVKIRDSGVVHSKSVYLALGVQTDGTRDVLGLWIESSESAKFWLKVFNDLKTRGVSDILIAVTDGLTGMEGALAAVFPKTTLQTCIVHLLRNSLDYVSWKDRRPLAQALRPIYSAPDADSAEAALNEFESGSWGQKHPSIVASWRRAWDRVIPFFAFAPAIRKLIYTTNAIESLHARLRKIIKTRGHFPNDEAATKLIWMALNNLTLNRSQSVREWREAMNQFAIAYGERFTKQSAR